MNNAELKKYMFPNRGDMQKLADELGCSKQDILGWFRPENVTKKNLRRYAKAKGIDEATFLQIASGPAPTSTDSKESKQKTYTDSVSEPNTTYGAKRLDHTKINTALFIENTALHKTIVERNELIVQLLEGAN